MIHPLVLTNPLLMAHSLGMINVITPKQQTKICFFSIPADNAIVENIVAEIGEASQISPFP